jgi:hypothetical protein
MSVIPGARSLRFAVPERHRYRELQALEDAVNFRLARLMAPCPRCEPVAGARCDEHACDVALIAGYLKAAHATMAVLSRASGTTHRDGGTLSPGSTDRHEA